MNSSMEHVRQPCRACLSTDHTTRLTDVPTSHLFTILSGVPFRNIPLSLCAKCSYLVRKYGTFRDMCQQTDIAFLGLRDGQQYDPQVLKILNEKHSNIAYNLIATPYPVNHYDVYIDEDEDKKEEISIKKDEEPPELVKQEILFEDPNEDLMQDTKSILSDTSNYVPSDADGFISSDDEVLAKKEARKKNTEKEVDYTKIVDKMIDKAAKKKKRKTSKSDSIIDKMLAKKKKKDNQVKERKNRNTLLDSFKKKLLDEVEQVQVFQQRKESDSYLKAKFKCDACFKGFAAKGSYELHMETHTIKTDFQCRLCTLCFKHTAALKKHFRRHCEIYTCTECTFETMMEHTATLHAKWHRGTMYNCRFCPQTFTFRSSMLSHVRIKHPSGHICPFCGYSYIGAKGLEAHINKRHLDKPVIPEHGPRCEMCNIQFMDDTALSTHLQVAPVHGGSAANTYKTDRKEPGKGDRQPRTIAAPVNRKLAPLFNNRMAVAKSLEKPIDCEKCGVEVHSIMEYHIHFRMNHPNEERLLYPEVKTAAQCHVCGKMFRASWMLKDHMSEHTDTPPQHKCDVCNKSFKRKSSLYLHSKTHKGLQYPCPICGKRFNMANNRNRHFTYVHSNVKDVKCDFCDKLFKSKETAQYHMNHVHLKKPWPKRDRQRREKDIMMNYNMDRQ